jgi:hypothetical protein
VLSHLSSIYFNFIKVSLTAGILKSNIYLKFFQIYFITELCIVDIYARN